MQNADDNGFSLHVAVADDAITVTAINRFTFRARAYTAANDKARELGWIV